MIPSGIPSKRLRSRSPFRLTNTGLIIGLAVIAFWPSALAAKKSAHKEEHLAPAALPAAPPAEAGKINVLFLGDSLALCGFGERLDRHFRGDARVQATFSYMTCGTNPLSWLKHKPYSNIKTQCGYWSIESSASEKEPRAVEDVYGMTAGHTPKAHLVPKLEDLIADVHPDVLVVQTGSNLFGLFPDAKTVHAAHHAAALKKYLLPFKEKAIEPPSNLRKIYWVNPPTSGRVGKEIQEFLFEQTRAQLGPEIMVIDSRTLVSYPYQHMEPDKEHFLGAQMDEWADKVFAIIDRDLAAQPLAALKPLHGLASASPIAATPTPVAVATATPTPPPPIPTATEHSTRTAGPLVVKARLVFKSQPMKLQELLPYQESLVGYVYEVDKIVRGQYAEKQILVMHPAFIGLKPQPLDKYRIGKRYKLHLRPLEGTLWDTAKARDESGQINLQPYIRVEDLAKHPANKSSR
ncbi:MAG: hypothetical protein M3Y03_04060 [Verrucomicrobiota bacterium]|nr:hypothetical protein [Verrucomicrobiota bacterium]